MRRVLMLSLVAASPLAQALEITWVPIQHKLELIGTCAAAASNGAGQCVFPFNSLGSAASFDDSLLPAPVVDRNDANDEIAVAFGSASQATFLLALGADSNGNVTTGNSIFRAGDSRAIALTETKSRFFASEDFYFRIDARVGCALATASSDCESFVTILEDLVPVFALRSTQGSLGDSMAGQLQANHVYTLWASSRAAAVQSTPGLNSASGDYSLQLQFATGPITTPVVPEPATWALGLAGLGVVAAALRRRRRF
ncbi:exported hypothetical protein [Rubrivivax sp. A210]|uniref:PEPxxWA-CTERM sorting domain-containing protein n=1 Tax=Rubrivivax sp. A210 TaxID=2772301 RepID=UPI0019181D4C|nr:PEPxxWA-CTERM sorting domain-containing protein [Rubrivivax sp. A210]CAD5372554.1 exported hypothetical protein [Rubrivivax sp. A210]